MTKQQKIQFKIEKLKRKLERRKDKVYKYRMKILEKYLKQTKIELTDKQKDELVSDTLMMPIEDFYRSFSEVTKRGVK